MTVWTRALGAAMLLVAFTGSAAFAWPDRLEGRPDQLEIGGDSAYYIWTEGEDVHLATTGPGPLRRFRAIVRTDGEIEDVDQFRLDPGDSYELRAGGKELVVEFHTLDHLDSVRWRVQGGTFMRFDLRVDGHPIRPQNVYLGAEGAHPLAPVFRVSR